MRKTARGKVIIALLLGLFALSVTSAILLIRSGIFGSPENPYIHLSANKYRLNVGSYVSFYVSSNLLNDSLMLLDNSTGQWIVQYGVNTNSSGMWYGGELVSSSLDQTIAFYCMNRYRNVTSNIINVTWVEPTYPVP
jgi:hypothetical protein